MAFCENVINQNFKENSYTFNNCCNITSPPNHAQIENENNFLQVEQHQEMSYIEQTNKFSSTRCQNCGFICDTIEQVQVHQCIHSLGQTVQNFNNPRFTDFPLSTSPYTTNPENNYNIQENNLEWKPKNDDLDKLQNNCFQMIDAVYPNILNDIDDVITSKSSPNVSQLFKKSPVHVEPRTNTKEPILLTKLCASFDESESSYVGYQSSSTDVFQAINNSTPGHNIENIPPNQSAVESNVSLTGCSEYSTNIQCFPCKRGFSKLSYFRQHNAAHHSKKLHRCSKCGKKFSNAEILRKHSIKHNGDKPHKCRKCIKSFNHKVDLMRHIASKHTGEFKYPCDVCNKGFVRKDHMTKHRQIHSRHKNVVYKTAGEHYTKLVQETLT